MSKQTIIISITAGVALCFLLASLFVSYQQNQLALMLQVNIAEQEKTLIAISEITDRNGADAIAEAIIRDCSSSNRNRFESLLNDLGTLDVTQLVEVESLFDACASFFAERKAIMVSRLEREYQIYTDYIALYALVDKSDARQAYPLEDWSEIVTLEKQRRDLLTEQVAIQGSIISALQSGTPNQNEFEANLVRASQISQAAASLNSSIDDVRQRLNNI